MTDADDGFLSRWARRKARVQGGHAEAAETPAPPADAVASPAQHANATPSAAPIAAPDAPGPAVESPPVPRAEPPPLPTMEDVARLTRSSDYASFVQPGIDPSVSNAAMKKLFSDPRYNVMDGLDTYIGDYNTPDPIPLAMLRQMNQAKFLGLFDDEVDETTDENGAGKGEAGKIAAVPVTSPDGTLPGPMAQSQPLEEAGLPAGTPETRPDDDADLRLQQDDPAERPGPAPGSRP